MKSTCCYYCATRFLHVVLLLPSQKVSTCLQDGHSTESYMISRGFQSCFMQRHQLFAIYMWFLKVSTMFSFLLHVTCTVSSQCWTNLQLVNAVQVLALDMIQSLHFSLWLFAAKPLLNVCKETCTEYCMSVLWFHVLLSPVCMFFPAMIAMFFILHMFFLSSRSCYKAVVLTDLVLQM
jgi:hypothetical protein